jgi:PadR family transcriptional regulator
MPVFSHCFEKSANRANVLATLPACCPSSRKPSALSEQESNTLHSYTSCVKEYVEVRGITTNAKSDLPQGTLDLLILKVVALGPVHGYAIAQRLQQVSRDVVQVPQGSLYPALHRLENRGLLIADWKETDTGREAKFYRLTRKGRAQLETEAVSWERLTEAVGLILKMSEGGAQ